MARKGSSPAPRYFIYVSDTKVDMLLGQVPPRLLKRIAAELTVNLKVLSVKLSPQEVSDNRFTRAVAVTKYIQEVGQLGSIEQPNQFIYVESMPMEWGHYRGWAREEDPGVVLFFGIKDDVRVALSGSLHHVVGAVAPPRNLDNRWNPGSMAVPPPSAFMNLFKTYGEDYSLDRPIQVINAGDTVAGLVTEYMSHDWAWRNIAEEFSFVARITHRFASTDFTKDATYQYLVGSPVWVSSATVEPMAR